MRDAARLAVLVAALLLIAAAPAGAATYCVNATGPGCTPRDTLADAFDDASASSDPDRIEVGTLTEAGAFSDLGTPIELAGAGADRTVLAAPATGTFTLRLTHADSRASGLAVRGRDAPGAMALDLRGLARAIRVDGGAAGSAARLRTGGALLEADVAAEGSGIAAEGAARIERTRIVADGAYGLRANGGDGAAMAQDVDLVGSGTTAALEVRCTSSGDGTLVARHLTITGAAVTGGRATCGEAGRSARLELASSVVRGELTRTFACTGTGLVKTAFSLYRAGDEDCEAAHREAAGDVDADPGFVSPTDRRPAPGSPLVDAGDPAPLATDEPLDDLGGEVRIADGDGEGTARRDIGAHEHQPLPPVGAAGNVLVNPGAEVAGGAPGVVPGWEGGFERVAYGDPLFPTRRAGDALGGGQALFAGGVAETAALVQRIDVGGSAAQIDAGGASAALSAQLGGYRADGDRATLEAVFRGPTGEVVGTLRVGPVGAGERGNATTLLSRAAVGAIPVDTRSIDVVLRGERATGSYDDAYADNLALVLSVPGIALPPPRGDDGTPPPRPFSGLAVVNPRVSVTRAGVAHVRVACASATVGRCAGRLELRTRLPRRKRPARIADANASVAPGRMKRIGLRLNRTTLRVLRGRRSFRATLVSTTRDGQGLSRTTNVPLRVRMPQPARRR